MAEFKEVMRNAKRLCDSKGDSNSTCKKCELFDMENCTCMVFAINILETYEDAEEIVMKWAEENPIKTNRDKFKEVFGEVFGIDDIPCLFKCPDGVKSCDHCEFNHFGDKEYVEPKNEKRGE